LSSVKIALSDLARLGFRIGQVEQKKLGAALDIAATVEAREECALAA
jgi:hypothetical protein